MEKNTKRREIEELTRQLEEMTGIKMQTPKDFDRLRVVIFNRTGELLSSTTLKRIWGYINEPLETRTSTLSILANALGYQDWETFEKSLGNPDEETPSTPVLGRKLSVMSELKAGDIVKLTWHPGRKCLVRYLGDGEFEVEESEKTRLQPGDTFFCHIVIAGHPLYLSELKQGGKEPTGYVCGRGSGGISFEVNPLR